MKKLILLLILFSAVYAQSQTYTGDKFNARIWMKSPLYFKGTDTLVSKLDTAGALKFGSLSPYMWNKINTGGSSQWTTTGNDIYYDSGNVGIGQDSTNYNRQLNVNGINAITGYREQGIISMVDVGSSLNNFTIRQTSPGHIRLQTDYKNTNSHIGFNLGNTTYSAVVVRRDVSGNPFIGIRAPSSEEPGSTTYESKLTAADDGLTISTNTGHLFLNPNTYLYTNNNFGIGISNPAYKLSIYHNTYTNNSEQVLFRAGTLVDTKSVIIGYVANGTTSKRGVIRTSGTIPLAIGVSGIPRAIYITETGNVAINDSIANYKFDINGNVNIRSGKYFLYNGISYKKSIDTVKTSLSTGLLKVTNGTGLLSTAVAGTDYQAALTNPVTGTGTTNTLSVFTGTSAIGNSMFNQDATATYAGIGVANSSSYKLNVGGALNISGSFTGASSISATAGVASNVASTTTTQVAGFTVNAASVATAGVTERCSPSYFFIARAWNTSTGSQTNGFSLRTRGITGNPTSGALVFENYLLDGASNTTEHMRLTTGGLLGISPSLTPVSALHIDKGTGTASSIQLTANATTGQTATDGTKLTINTDGSSEINNQENTSFVIKTNNTTATTIDNAQNLTQVGRVEGSNIETNLTSLSTRIGVNSGSGENESTTRKNTFIGYYAGSGTSTAINNTIVGADAANNISGSANTILGVSSGGAAGLSGDYNSIIGYGAGGLTSANNNVINGAYAAVNAAGADNNVIVGYGAVQSGVIKNDNVISGYKAGYNLTDSANVVVGSEALYTATSSYMGVHIGRKSGYYITTGDYNTGIGWLTNSKVTTGASNTAVGCQANRNTTGSSNTSVGNAAGINTDGSYNTFIGAESSSSTSNTGSSNVFIGYKAGFYTLNKSNRFALGNASSGSAALDSTNQLMWGMFNNTNLTKQYLRVNGDFSYELSHAFLDKSADYTPAVTQNVYTKVTPTFTSVEAAYITVDGDSITITRNGDYILTYNVTLNGANGDDFTFQLRKNGASVKAVRQTTTGATNYHTITVKWYFDGLVIGDDLSVWVTNTSSSGDPTLSSQDIYIRKEHN